jgi:RimJ/RimL family protein N-acetyltransferase
MPTKKAETELTDGTSTQNFLAEHLPALEQDEVKHNLILASLGRLAIEPSSNLRLWTLGSAGACAIQSPGYPIVLGELDQAQCCVLAEETQDLDYPGVVGPDRTAPWFVERAVALGLSFGDPIPQQIHALRNKPSYPGAPGRSRLVGPEDSELFAEWIIAFLREAAPHDPAPHREWIKRNAAQGHGLLWIVDGEPVSTATIARRTCHTAAISRVYTPLHCRGRGYAGSVTAALVERIFAEGRHSACLYTDLRNPFSNRCYAKIGFKPVCPSWHFPRVRASA